MKVTVAVLAVAVAAMVVAAPAAGADPTPEPSPYQIQGPNGPVYGGMRTLPPICGAQPRACASFQSFTTARSSSRWK